jgi:Ca-activated chloride channel family protein
MEGMKHFLRLDVGSDHASIERDQETVMHLVAEVTATSDGLERDRPPMTVVFVLDVSGSMNGEPLHQVKKSTQRLIQMLRPDDRAGVIAFATNATTVASVRPTTDAAKRDLVRAVAGMAVQDMTNIEAGLRLAYETMPERRQHERCVVLLLSDGQPNHGVTSPDGLSAVAASMRQRVATCTLGFGHNHSEPILSAIAEGGGGNYHYIRDPALSHVQFAAALGAQGEIVAEAIELVIAPKGDVEVLSVLGEKKPRYAKGGVAIDIPDLIANVTHKVAARLRVRAGRECGPTKLAEVTLRYRPAGASAELTVESSLEIPVTRDPSKLLLPGLHKVLILRAEEERRAARELGDKRRFAEAAKLLRTAASMIEQVPGFRKDDGSELAEAWDQLNDDADLYDQHPDDHAYAEFRRGQRISKGGDVFAGSRAPVARSTRALIEDAAGPIPNAVLLRIDSGERYALAKPVNIIGRSAMCDVHVPSAKVSRQSAAVVAEGGTFWVEDLGSSNGVFIDGSRIQRHRLRDGDVIQIGDAQLRYVVD